MNASLTNALQTFHSNTFGKSYKPGSGLRMQEKISKMTMQEQKLTAKLEIMVGAETSNELEQGRNLYQIHSEIPKYFMVKLKNIKPPGKLTF